jgi:hypothetical protein
MPRVSHNTSAVYSNSLLATLNSRSRIRDALNEPMSFELSPIGLSSYTRGRDVLTSHRAATPLSLAKGAVSVVDPSNLLAIPQPQDIVTQRSPDYDLHVKGVYTM